MTEREQAQAFIAQEPVWTTQEEEAVNALFPAYIFRRKRTGEIWTTCCRQYKKFPGGFSPEVLQAPHVPCNPPRFPAQATSDWNELTPCPFCKRLATVKELGRTGRRQNLLSFRRAMLLRWDGEALWARAYDLKKDYENQLLDSPQCKLIALYRFRPGLAESSFYYGYYGGFNSVQRQDHGFEGKKRIIKEIWYGNEEDFTDYDVEGIEEIAKSPFRYCMGAEFAADHGHIINFLTACCFYPRQIEMLMKAGMQKVVADFVIRKVKHALVIRWEETNPAKAFRMNRQEMKEFLGTSREIEIAETYLRLKKKASINECADWIRNGLNLKALGHAAKIWNVPPEKLARYLRSFVGCAAHGGMSSIQAALNCWLDYLTAAEALNEPLHRENVLLPKNLGAAHDDTTARHAAQIGNEKDALWAREHANLEKEYQELRIKLEEKYRFVLDEYEIRIPQNGAEILAEGRALQHCVGGYAQRHLEGKVVILFMRKTKRPDKPWLTIEMDWDRIRQIHGYRNEGLYTSKGRFAPDPREVYAEWLDTWLAWLKAGSKRNEDGSPKLPKKKGAAA